MLLWNFLGCVLSLKVKSQATSVGVPQLLSSSVVCQPPLLSNLRGDGCITEAVCLGLNGIVGGGMNDKCICQNSEIPNLGGTGCIDPATCGDGTAVEQVDGVDMCMCDAAGKFILDVPKTGCVCDYSKHYISDGAGACTFQEGYIDEAGTMDCALVAGREIINLRGDGCIAEADCPSQTFYSIDADTKRCVCVNSIPSLSGLKCIASDGSECGTGASLGHVNGFSMCVCNAATPIIDGNAGNVVDSAYLGICIAAITPCTDPNLYAINLLNTKCISTTDVLCPAVNLAGTRCITSCYETGSIADGLSPNQCICDGAASPPTPVLDSTLNKCISVWSTCTSGYIDSTRTKCVAVCSAPFIAQTTPVKQCICSGVQVIAEDGASCLANAASCPTTASLDGKRCLTACDEVGASAVISNKRCECDSSTTAVLDSTQQKCILPTEKCTVGYIDIAGKGCVSSCNTIQANANGLVCECTKAAYPVADNAKNACIKLTDQCQPVSGTAYFIDFLGERCVDCSLVGGAKNPLSIGKQCVCDDGAVFDTGDGTQCILSTDTCSQIDGVDAFVNLKGTMCVVCSSINAVDSTAGSPCTCGGSTPVVDAIADRCIATTATCAAEGITYYYVNLAGTSCVTSCGTGAAPSGSKCVCNPDTPVFDTGAGTQCIETSTGCTPSGGDTYYLNFAGTACVLSTECGINAAGLDPDLVCACTDPLHLVLKEKNGCGTDCGEGLGFADIVGTSCVECSTLNAVNPAVGVGGKCWCGNPSYPVEDQAANKCIKVSSWCAADAALQPTFRDPTRTKCVSDCSVLGDFADDLTSMACICATVGQVISIDGTGCIPVGDCTGYLSLNGQMCMSSCSEEGAEIPTTGNQCICAARTPVLDTAGTRCIALTTRCTAALDGTEMFIDLARAGCTAACDSTAAPDTDRKLCVCNSDTPVVDSDSLRCIAIDATCTDPAWVINLADTACVADCIGDGIIELDGHCVCQNTMVANAAKTACSCPAATPFVEDTGECTTQCTSGYYTFANGVYTCVVGCTQNYVLNETNGNTKWCVETCPNTHPILLNTQCLAVVCSATTPYQELDATCSATCASGSYELIGGRKFCVAQGSCAYYANFPYTNNLNECMAACNATYPYLEGKKCSATCSFYVEVLGQKTCYKSCSLAPGDRPYYVTATPAECLSQCPTEYPYPDAENVCRARCNSGRFQVEGTNEVCVPGCPNVYIIREDKDNQKECLAACPNTKKVRVGQECVASCPSGFKASSTGLCVTARTSNKTITGISVGVAVGVLVIFIGVLAAIMILAHKKASKAPSVKPNTAPITRQQIAE